MSKLRVLIAEDHDGMRSFIVGLLVKDYHVVGAVCDGEQLVRAASCLTPDVIVTDIQMPRMSGLKARDELRAQGKLFPFVFVSASGPDVVKLLPTDRHDALVYKGDMAACLGIAIEAAIAGRPYRSPLYKD